MTTERLKYHCFLILTFIVKSVSKNLVIIIDSPCEMKQLSWKSVSFDVVSGSSGASAHLRLETS